MQRPESKVCIVALAEQALRAAYAAWFPLFLLAGCSDPKLAEDVIATYRGGEITHAELEELIFELPDEQRRPTVGDFTSWYREVSRELALRELILAGAENSGSAEDPEFLRIQRDATKQELAAAFLARNMPQPEPVTEQALVEFYQEHRTEYEQRARRQVLNIFRRREAGSDPEPPQQELKALRTRIIAGESFPLLASRHSDSESRHRFGLVGTFTRGQLAPALDEIVFALQVKTPSQLITTRDGVHLFWVEEAVEDKIFDFEEVRGILANRLAKERYHEALLGLELDTELPPGSFVPEPPELQALIASGDERSLILRIGDYEMRAGDFVELLRSAVREQNEPGPVVARRLLETLHRHELIYRHCLAQGLDTEPVVARRLNQIRQAELFAFELGRRLGAEVEGDPESLKRYWQDNRKRFSEPLRLRLERLRVPITADADEPMSRLEIARFELDAGQLRLADIATELGGSTDELGWRTVDELRAIRPQMAEIIVTLAADQHSPPYRGPLGLELLRVAERQEPLPLPFERVRMEVRASFLEHHGQEVYRKFAARTLEESQFQFSEEGLRAFAARAALSDAGSADG